MSTFRRLRLGESLRLMSGRETGQRLLTVSRFPRYVSSLPPRLFPPAADPIDLSDDRWEVFYLFEEETAREVLGEKWRPLALAGFMTVFGFRNPVKGVSLRVCQALIMPEFQRQGDHYKLDGRDTFGCLNPGIIRLRRPGCIGRKSPAISFC